MDILSWPQKLNLWEFCFKTCLWDCFYWCLIYLFNGGWSWGSIFLLDHWSLVPTGEFPGAASFEMGKSDLPVDFGDNIWSYWKTCGFPYRLMITSLAIPCVLWVKKSNSNPAEVLKVLFISKLVQVLKWLSMSPTYSVLLRSCIASPNKTQLI